MACVFVPFVVSSFWSQWPLFHRKEAGAIEVKAWDKERRAMRLLQIRTYREDAPPKKEAQLSTAFAVCDYRPHEAVVQCEYVIPRTPVMHAMVHDIDLDLSIGRL